MGNNLKNIVFDPKFNEENTYATIIVQELLQNGLRVFSLREAVTNYILFRKISHFHFNWYENLYDKNLYTQLLSFFQKIIILILIKIHRKKIIWTMHNKQSHNQKLGLLKGILRNLLIKWSERIIIHSHVSSELINEQYRSKLVYIPHPNYIDVYITPSGPKRTIDKSTKIQLLFLGAIKPYKGIEILIDAVRAFSSDILELKIIGMIHSASYKEMLLKKLKGVGNIKFDFSFVEDGALISEIQQCDLLVFPYNINSSLNSGSVYLAFSNKKTVICPLIGSIIDIPIKDRRLYTYQYNGDEDHYEQLSTILRGLTDKVKYHPEVLEEDGQYMYDYIVKNHNNRETGKMFSELYK